ncbi:hypothetical protein AB0F30_17090 [Streptomyces sp. NPDC029006]|uniref:hypothetical protein n=1 Tax=Streptomyces sp. NPDC029006 TaxID=3155467 RepID=UPI0033D47C15
MASASESGRYETFACGFDCHFDRYTVFTTRTRFGFKRWGVRDEHKGIALSRLCRSSVAVEEWRMSLTMMELREREYAALRAEAASRAARDRRK